MPNPAEDDFGPWTKTTPSDGRVVFSQLVAEDDYEIVVDHPDYESTTAQLYLTSEGEETTYQIEEIPESSKYRLTIRVLNTSGLVVSGVTVSTNGVSKTTDSNGEVWFDLVPDTHEVTFSHPDYQDTTEYIALGTEPDTESITLQDTSSSGPSGEVICRTNATVAPGEALTLTIEEDIDSTGTIDNTVTIGVPDGAATHTLDEFTPTGTQTSSSTASGTSTGTSSESTVSAEDYNVGGYSEGGYGGESLDPTFGEGAYGDSEFGGTTDTTQDDYGTGDFGGGSYGGGDTDTTTEADNSYTVTAEFTAESDEGTPQLHSVEIEAYAANPIAAVYGRVGGSVVEVPLYDPADVGDARFQASPPGIDIAVVGLVDRSESALQCRTPDGKVHGVDYQLADTT